MKNPVSFTLICLVFISSFVSCQEEQHPFPFERLGEVELDKDYSDQLIIPYFQDGKYGLSNYDGEIILSPRFKQVKLIGLSFPFFWASEKIEVSESNLALYDINGTALLNEKGEPLLHSNGIGSVFNTRMKLENEIVPHTVYGIPIDPTLPKSSTSKFTGSKESWPSKFLILSKYLKPPYNKFYYNAPAKRRNGTNPPFTMNRFSTESYIKVKTEEGLHTYLDEAGKELIPPVYDCQMLTKDCFQVIKKEGGLVAVKNDKEDWETDYMFTLVFSTESKNIFSALKREKRYLVYNQGKIKEIPLNEKWEVVDEKFTVVIKVEDGKETYRLWDNETYQFTNEIPADRQDKLFSLMKKNRDTSADISHLVSSEGSPVVFPEHFYTKVGENLQVIKENDSLIYVQKDGTIITTVRGGKRSRTTDKFIQVKDENGKSGIISKTGKLVLPIEFDRIKYYAESKVVFAQKDGFYSLYSSEGEKLSDLDFTDVELNQRTKVGVGNLYTVKMYDASYVINDELKIVSEDFVKNPIIKKSDFKIGKVTEEIKNDFDQAGVQNLFSYYMIFRGEKFAHIFKINGDYIKSIRGSFIKTEADRKTIYKDGITNSYEFTGLMTIRRDEQKYWVRLADGMEYSDD